MKNKRLNLRIEERIAITVSNESAGWVEDAETENISTHGCLFSLTRNVAVGDRLMIETKRAPRAVVVSEVIRFVEAHRLVAVSLSPNRQWLELFVHLSMPKHFHETGG